MALSTQDVLHQNSLGNSEGFPSGVPHHWNWYQGWSNDGLAQLTPPSGFTSVTGWGQVYQQEGEANYTNANSRVEVSNARTYVHLRSTGEWVLVQDQSTDSISGGHFATNYAGNSASAMNISSSNGTASFGAPTSSYNDHFWVTNRGTYTANDVDAVYVTMDMRVTDSNLNVVANVGADWWQSNTAAYRDDHSTNPGVGSSNWIELSTEWQTLGFISDTNLLQSDPPPGLTGSGSGSGNNSGEEPTQPPTVTENLLVNGSFESTTVANGQWSSSSSISGWTALSGSSIELWNNHNGVRASNGSNFGELDYLSGQDGFYQTVRTQAGQSYSLSFDARSRPGSSSSTTTIEVLWNNTVIASVPPGANWSNHTFTVTGTGGNDRLTFRETQGQGGDGVGALYDNVVLTASGTTTNPTNPTNPTDPTTPRETGNNILVNGSFEASTVASNQWAGFQSIEGWSAVTGGTIELWNNLNGVTATDGSNFGELDYLSARDGLYQTVRTESGQDYALSFDARSRTGFTSSTTSIEVLWNDTVIATVPPGSDWSTHTFTVTGTGGNDRLTFREPQNQGGDGLGALYDNVSLVATSSSSTSTSAMSTDRSLDLMTQYSASTTTSSNTSATSVIDSKDETRSLATTLAGAN